MVCQKPSPVVRPFWLGNMKWFKFYGTEYLADPKMLALSSEERSCWITLLCYASVIGDNGDDNANDNGVIRYLDEEKLMLQAGLSPTDDCWDRTVGVLKKFENLDMIQNDNGMITVKNWLKRQDTNLTAYERVKKHRSKKRNDNAKITLEERRGDKNNIYNTSKEKFYWKPYNQRIVKVGEVWKAWRGNNDMQELDRQPLEEEIEVR